MKCKIENDTYIANEGYVFKNKITNTIAKGLRLGVNDSIENYEIIEKPIEEETTNESLEELSKEELIERLKEVSNE